MKQKNNVIAFPLSNKQRKSSYDNTWKDESHYKYEPLFSYKKIVYFFFKKDQTVMDIIKNFLNIILIDFTLCNR
ncbi:hypothetical protein ACUC2M_14535 [Bacillus cytotoxicus]